MNNADSLLDELRVRYEAVQESTRLDELAPPIHRRPAVLLNQVPMMRSRFR